MSYDYNALVSKIASTRQKAAAAATTDDEKLAHLQESVDTFSTLSTHCPMTPLLWMQYSADTAELLEGMTKDTNSARETQIQLLELALAEFPGSAALHLYYIQHLQQQQQQQTIASALENAIQSVGQGSHGNEAVLIAQIYQLAADHYSASGNHKEALGLFVQRSRVPMKDENQSLSAIVQAYCQAHSVSSEQQQDTLQLLEEGRRFESKAFSELVTCEDEIDIAMHNEGILPRHQVNLEELSWSSILQSDGKMYWMGYGGMQSANAFIQYAQKCYRFRSSDHEIEQTIKGLALSVFERGIAECPTVETLWLAYIRHLQFLAREDKQTLARLKAVVDRSVRNYPYSLQLYEIKLQMQATLANEGVIVFDPDELQKIVKDAIESKFIASREACLALQMTIIKLVRRQMLHLLSRSSLETGKKTILYDEAEPLAAELPIAAELDESTSQEVEDLCDDIREIYDGIDAYLRKNFSDWSEGRAHLWADRAHSEAFFLGPLSEVIAAPTSEVQKGDANTRFKEVIRCYDKATKVHNPTHPEVYEDYIQSLEKSYPCTRPSNLISKIRQTRFLYQRALKSIGRPKVHASVPILDPLQQDFESASRSLFHKYLVFERYFGSDSSLAAASKAVQKKLYKHDRQPDDLQADDRQQYKISSSEPKESLDDRQQGSEPVETGKKRDLDEETETEEGPSKKPKIENAEMGATVSQFKYHPYTIRVSHLHVSTEDMDLVDALRPKCGPIVHAKIMREKHHNHRGKSKGWGLVQFETTQSVETALSLNDVIGISGKFIKMERSQMPAASLVPPGMHRVNPKGEGRSSKRNAKRKEQRETGKEPQAKSSDTPDTSKPDSANVAVASVLAFRPRGVTRNKGRKQKVSLALDKDD